MKKNKGFTLIELLVVIAIIAILSTVVMAGLNSARAKGRDAKRLSDIKQLQTALELFFDTCGGYPSRPFGPILTDGTAPATGLGGGTNTVSGATCTGHTFGEFMNPLPSNPAPNGTPYIYCSAKLDDLEPARAALVAGYCSGDKSFNYRIGFSLEGKSGSLDSGYHMASPNGLI